MTSEVEAALRAQFTAAERRVAELEAELARLKSPPRVVKAAAHGPFVMPDLGQVEKLVQRVMEVHPALKRDIDHGGIEWDRYIQMTRASMLFVSSLRRLRGAVNSQRGYLDWLISAGDHLAGIGYSCTTVVGSSFYAAVVASGDVPHSSPRLWPTYRDVGLIIGTQSDSYPASNKWLDVLEGRFDAKMMVEPPPMLGV